MTNTQSYGWEGNSGSSSGERDGVIRDNILNMRLLWKTEPITKTGFGCK